MDRHTVAYPVMDDYLVLERGAPLPVPLQRSPVQKKQLAPLPNALPGQEVLRVEHGGGHKDEPARYRNMAN